MIIFCRAELSEITVFSTKCCYCLFTPFLVPLVNDGNIRGQGCILILLDLLAASDNINQKDLLTWLGTLSVDL